MDSARLRLAARSRRSLAASLFAVAVFAYAPSLRHDFVAWDDAAYITANPMFTEALTADTVRRAFEPYEANWIPLTWLSLGIDHALFGDDPAGYHAVNALWHAATAALLLLTLARSTGALLPAAFVAVCFALHPLRVESVAWATERKDVLSGFFFVASIAFWLAYGSRPGAARFLGALAAGAASLLAKPTAVTLPFVLLLLDFWPLARLGGRAASGRAFVEKLPFFALAAFVAAQAFAAQRLGGPFEPLALSLDVRAGNAAVSYLWYVEKAFWPTGLGAFYPHPRAMPAADTLGLVAFAGVAVTIAALALARLRPWLTVGWLWFLGMLVPMIGLVQVGMQARADRYAYLPLLGLEIAVAFEMWAWLGSWRTGRWIYAAAICAAALALGVALRVQLAYWHDTESLFSRALAVTDENYLALERVGRARLAAGDVDGAIRHFSEALRVEPRWADPRSGLAEALWQRGNRDEAILNFREAVRLDPSDARLRELLARALIDMGWYDDAIPTLRLGVRLARPDERPRLRMLLAVELARRGDVDAARRQAEDAVADAPTSAEAHELLGRLRLLAGRAADAIVAYRAALALRPDLASAANDLAWILATARDAALRDPREALELAEAAAAVSQRRDPTRLDTLAVAQAANGRFEEAVATLDTALALPLDASGSAAAMTARRALFVARQPYVDAGPPP